MKDGRFNFMTSVFYPQQQSQINCERLTKQMWNELQTQYSNFTFVEHNDMIFLCTVIEGGHISAISCIDKHMGCPDMLNHLISSQIYIDLKYKYHREIYEYHRLMAL